MNFEWLQTVRKRSDYEENPATRSLLSGECFTASLRFEMDASNFQALKRLAFFGRGEVTAGALDKSYIDGRCGPELWVLHKSVPLLPDSTIQGDGMFAQ